MSLSDARMPSLRDKLEAKALEVVVPETKEERREKKLEKGRIIKNNSKK